MRFLLTIILLNLLLFSVLFAGNNVLFPRTPAPSPDGAKIAFSFQGDIWTVPAEGGTAVRITAHPAYDHMPQWSPDAEQIAFSSDRYGNDDIYLMSLNGDGVERLTYFSGADRLVQWHPDGKSLLFCSTRDFYYHRLPLTYQVSISGGTPVEFLDEYANQSCLSPDQNYLLFVKGRASASRKHYRGSSNADVFMYDFRKKSYKKLTQFDGSDMFPVWATDSHKFYFVSDEDGTANLYEMNKDGSAKKQLSFFKEDGIRYLSISADGKLLAMERGFDLYTYHPGDSEPARLNFDLPLDYSANPIIYKKYSSKVSEYHVSPDGKQVAFVIRGEIFVTTENGRFLNQITESSARDQNVFWAPNSDSLLYVSDAAGQKDVILLSSGDPQQKMLARTMRLKKEKLISGKNEEFNPKFSPDGKKVSFIRNKGDLFVYDLKMKKEKSILKTWADVEYSWSPDSRWIAYAVEDNEFNADVWLYNLETEKKYNISQHPDYDFSPRWSADGKRIAFVSKRVGDNWDIWMAFLKYEDYHRATDEWEEIFDKKDKKDKDKKIVVEIDDPEKLYTRLQRVTSLPGEESSFDWSPDGQFIAFNSNSGGKGELWKVQWNGKDVKQLSSNDARPSQIQWHAGNKKIYSLQKGGRIVSVNADGGKKKNISFSVNMKIDVSGEQKQKFAESWRTLNEHFYDPDFHGADWQKMYDKYLPAAASVHNQRDFDAVVRLMLGELNASHLGISSPSNSPSVSSGMLGLRLEKNNGELVIKEVMPDGPADRVKLPARKGEKLIAIDGIKLSENINYYNLLENKVGKSVELLLKAGDGSTRSIVVKPVSRGNFNTLEYMRWRSEKRELTEKLSKGKLGYIHIRAMGETSMERFEMELYAAANNKDGLVIDVRNNGGGWTADYILNMLMIKNHAVTIPRDGGKGYPQGRRPLYAWTKPIIVLCNEYSYSNAEIFSHAVKTLGRGKVVGKPTGGLVISTGAIRLIDGASFRVPFRGWYVKGSGLNMENNGAVPDIIVEDLPGDAAKHKDRQLERAIEEILKEI